MVEGRPSVVGAARDRCEQSPREARTKERDRRTPRCAGAVPEEATVVTTGCGYRLDVPRLRGWPPHSLPCGRRPLVGRPRTGWGVGGGKSRVGPSECAALRPGQAVKEQGPGCVPPRVWCRPTPLRARKECECDPVGNAKNVSVL